MIHQTYVAIYRKTRSNQSEELASSSCRSFFISNYFILFLEVLCSS